MGINTVPMDLKQNSFQSTVFSFIKVLYGVFPAFPESTLRSAYTGYSRTTTFVYSCFRRTCRATLELTLIHNCRHIENIWGASPGEGTVCAIHALRYTRRRTDIFAFLVFSLIPSPYACHFLISEYQLSTGKIIVQTHWVQTGLRIRLRLSRLHKIP